MSVKEGDKLLGRFAVASPLPSIGELRRWSVTDPKADGPIEIIQLSPRALLLPNSREHFLAAHREMDTGAAISKAIWVGEHSGSPAAVYPLAHAPFPAAASLEADEAMAMASWLAPSILSNLGAHADGLRPEDLVIDKEGVLRLRPAGVVNVHSLAKMDVFQCDGSPVEKGLYGLGMMLFGALCDLPTAKNPAELEKLQKNPPKISSFLPDIDPVLQELVDGLRSPDPKTRRKVAERLSEGPPFTVPLHWIQKEESAPAVQRSAPAVHQPQQSLSRARQDLPLPKFVVFIEEQRIPDTIRRRLSAITSVDDQCLKRELRDAGPIPLGGGNRLADAKDLLEEIESLGLSAKTDSAKGGVPLAIPLTASLIVGAGVFAFNALAGIGIGAILAVGSFIAAGMKRSGRRSSLQSRWNDLHSPGNRDPMLSEARSALQEARRSILASPLPSVLQRDLLGAADDIDDALDDRKSITAEEKGNICNTARELRSAAETTTGSQADLSKQAGEKVANVKKVIAMMRDI
jgi:hypothetical protein